MKSLLAVVAAGMLLASCTEEEQVLVQKYHIVQVPPQLYNCPVVQTFPQVKTLTERQVANLIVQLHSNNLTCRQSLDAIRRYLAQAERTVR